MTFQVHRFTPGLTRTPYPQNQSITQRERENAFHLHAEHNSALLTAGTPTVTIVLYSISNCAVTENVFYLCVVFKEQSHYIMWVMVDALLSGVAMKTFQ